MTPPIQEPTDQRVISGQRWGISQLARRPAPRMAGPGIQWARVEGISTASADDGVRTSINWVTYAIDPTADAFSIDTSLRPFKILRGGWYMLFLDFEWNDSGYTDERFYEIIGGVSDIAVNGSVSMYVNQTADYESGTQFTWLNHFQAGGGSLRLEVIQNSGGSRDITTGSMSIVFLGGGNGIDDGTTVMDDIRVDF